MMIIFIGRLKFDYVLNDAIKRFIVCKHLYVSPLGEGVSLGEGRVAKTTPVGYRASVVILAFSNITSCLMREYSLQKLFNKDNIVVNVISVGMFCPSCIFRLDVEYNSLNVVDITILE